MIGLLRGSQLPVRRWSHLGASPETGAGVRWRKCPSNKLKFLVGRAHINGRVSQDYIEPFAVPVSGIESSPDAFHKIQPTR